MCIAYLVYNAALVLSWTACPAWCQHLQAAAEASLCGEAGGEMIGPCHFLSTCMFPNSCDSQALLNDLTVDIDNANQQDDTAQLSTQPGPTPTQRTTHVLQSIPFHPL